MQGNGLGLTIAKNLALQLGGDITLESHPHQKTVFTIMSSNMRDGQPHRSWSLAAFIVSQETIFLFSVFNALHKP